MVSHEVVYYTIGATVTGKCTYKFPHGQSKAAAMICMEALSIQYSKDTDIDQLWKSYPFIMKAGFSFM